MKRSSKHALVVFLISFAGNLGWAQFGKVDVTFDDQLLKGHEKQTVLPLKQDIQRFFKHTTWDQEYSDLQIPLHIQIIFEGTSTKGAAKTYLAQALFTNGSDQRYFDKAVQFIYNGGTSLYYDPVRFDPLSSFLAFYGNLILAGEIDTYVPQGGTSTYELCRNIALRGNSSDYGRGWGERLKLADILSSNYGLRNARFSYYYAMDLIKTGELDQAVEEFKAMMKGLNTVYERSPRDHYTVMFLQAHASRLATTLAKLGRRSMLERLMLIDPDNREIYQSALVTISR